LSLLGNKPRNQKRRWSREAFMLKTTLLLACLFGCTTRPNPASCVDDGFCDDPSLPFCDRDGSVAGGNPNTCIAINCEPGAFEQCRGDEALVCNATGNNLNVLGCTLGCNEASAACNECVPNGAQCVGGTLQLCGSDGRPQSMETCRAGCVDSTTPHCGYLEPKYLPDICDQLATLPELLISGNSTLDTSLDASCSGGVMNQVDGPQICVIRHSAIRVEAGATLSVTGTRALALVGDSSVDIDGIVDVSANTFTSGPGGGVTTSGSAAPSFSTGGGGAGFKGPGGAGASMTTNGGALNGGVAVPLAAVTAFVGGPKGAVNGALLSAGGGGGALTAIACRGDVRVSSSGLIDAGGGGGFGGRNIVMDSSPTGGGAGGNVILQGLSVIVSGSFFANGGGGGAGFSETVVFGADGQDGGRSATAAAPGGPAAGNAGAGGSGSVKTAPNANEGNIGRMPTSPNAPFGFPGAGGGGAGYFQTFTPTGVTPAINPAASSPDFEPNATTAIR
jgi:hypothetical protein